MELQDFATLEDARAYTVVSTKMISADQMRIFVVICGLYSYFKLHDGDYQMATYDNMISGGEFNFINGHPSNITSLLDVMISLDPPQGQNLAKLRDMCVYFANRVSFPFKDTTAEVFDDLKLKQAFLGEQLPSHIEYLGGNNKHVKLSNEDVRLTVRLDAPVLVDTIVDFELLIRNTDDQEFSPVQNWTFQITVPAGSTTSTREITNTRKLTRHTQFTAKSNVLNPFTVEVTGA